MEIGTELEAWVDTAGGPVQMIYSGISIQDETGAPRVLISHESDDNLGAIEFADSTGMLRASLGEFGLGFLDETGEVRSGMTEEGLVLGDSTGTWSAILSQDGLVFLDDAGGLRTSVTEEGIILFDDAGNTRMGLIADGIGACDQTGEYGFVVDSAAKEIQMNWPVRGVFPTPAYDSGWFQVFFDQQFTAYHGLGGDPGRYVVDVIKRGPDGTITNLNVPTHFEWMYNDSVVQVRSYYGNPQHVRIRIWEYKQ